PRDDGRVPAGIREQQRKSKPVVRTRRCDPRRDLSGDVDNQAGRDEETMSLVDPLKWLKRPEFYGLAWYFRWLLAVTALFGIFAAVVWFVGGHVVQGLDSTLITI